MEILQHLEKMCFPRNGSRDSHEKQNNFFMKSDPFYVRYMYVLIVLFK